MQTVTNENFGPLIAYLLPGATVLLGLSIYSPTLQAWFAISPDNAPTIGGFLYLTGAALTAGMTVSAIRWLVIDTLHNRTRMPAPPLDFSRLGPNVDGFAILIDIHYRHYLFHANMCVAAAFAYFCYRLKLGVPTFSWLDGAVILVEAVFFVTSRDNLRKYHVRSQQLLSTFEHPKRQPPFTRASPTPAPAAPRTGAG